MNLKPIVLLLTLTVLFFACDQGVTTPVSTDQFFDLKSYFDQEQVRLKTIKQVIKKATIDGKLEEKTMDAINFKEELALFVDSDINKISWLDKYTIDTTQLSGEIVSIKYLAKEESLKTNSLVIHYEKKEVSQINIIRKTSSLAADLEQELVYQPNVGYSIKSHQKTSISDPHVLELDVQFVQ